jgi:hypothetical protein
MYTRNLNVSPKRKLQLQLTRHLQRAAQDEPEFSKSKTLAQSIAKVQ